MNDDKSAVCVGDLWKSPGNLMYLVLNMRELENELCAFNFMLFTNSDRGGSGCHGGGVVVYSIEFMKANFELIARAK